MTDLQYLLVFLAVAALALFTSILGFLGTRFVSKKYTVTYVIFIILTIALQATLGVLFIIQAEPANVNSYLFNSWENAMHDQTYRVDVQNDFTCCGYENPQSNPAITSHCSTKSTLPGCYKLTFDFMTNNYKTYAIDIFAALIVEAIVLTNAFFMLCARNRKSKFAFERNESERSTFRKSGMRLMDSDSVYDGRSTPGGKRSNSIALESRQSYIPYSGTRDVDSYYGDDDRLSTRSPPQTQIKNYTFAKNDAYRDTYHFTDYTDSVGDPRYEEFDVNKLQGKDSFARAGYY
ncbi:hypothetical protein BZG36_00518 [Bifiguratus adelaidae]|uniref:Tetraspanin n=1 Tax=Bifiguratus adelaidae TaxID=1938954 RepID=A0A261Y786_9FUNG|nr:hypothetical protein BZG36_00518 [Bifiguratus adelaidae]